MVIKKAMLAAVAISAISVVGFADGGRCAAGSCKANDSVMNGDMPIVMEDHDHVKGTVTHVEMMNYPNGKKMRMVVRTDDGEDVNVSVNDEMARNANVHIGDRVSIHGRKTQCNGEAGILRCEKMRKDGTVNLNQTVKTK